MAAKEDCEMLMNSGVPLAQRILQQHGEFLPFAAAMRPNGEITYLGAHDGRDYQPLFDAQSDLIRALKQVLIAGARRQEYMATALFYDVGFTVPGQSERADAIAISLDHRDGYSVVVLLPYKLENGRAMLDVPRAQAGEADIFPTN